MDISAFSEENFDTKAWVNNILKSSDDPEKEKYSMSLVMKLQLYVEQVNKALEETSQQVFISIPKIMRDSKNLQLEATSLRDKMVIVKDEITKIEQDTGSSISLIEKLDRIKNVLSVAKQGLHESDNWSVLVNDLEEAFDFKNIVNISSKLVSMQQSLKLLTNIHDYEDRKLQLEGLKNRLEAIASPLIVQAFTTNNTDQACFYTKVFCSIERFPQLLKYYHKCQKDLLMKKWRDQLEVEQDETVGQLLHNYYDTLLSNWHTQCRWLGQVFPNHSAFELLIDIYTDLIISLDPSINKFIDAPLRQQSEKLAFMYDIKLIIQQFAQYLVKIINNTSQERILKEKLVSLLQAIYNPLVIYVSNYAVYEQTFLNQKLTQVKCMKDELSDTIQALGLTIPLVFDIAKEAKKRCEQITENCGFCGLLKALRGFLLNYADIYRVALRQIDRIQQSTEDWTTFKLCLSLLQNTGEVLINLQEFEENLTTTVLNFNRNDDDINYKFLLLNVSERKEYDSLVKCVTEGTRLSLLDHAITEFTKLCSDIHNTTYQVIFNPIAAQLNSVQSKMWTQLNSSDYHISELPDYSYTPQEYITQIGQYLMTLPQHLEPFLFHENPSLNCALKAADPKYNNADDVEGALADIFLGIIARGTCQGYCDQILSTCELSLPASRQLTTDISYFGNVLEDLNLELTDNLKQLLLLLKLPADQYQSQSSGCSARYVATVRQMRNIKSSG